MSKQIRSTLEGDTRYEEDPTGLTVAPRSILVKGLHRGAATTTEVSDEDAAFLANHPHFKEHEQRGFVKFV